jgi:hypothetical protein
VTVPSCLLPVASELPTEKQAFASLFVIQMLSNLLQSIHLFRYDQVTKQAYIIAGEHEGIEIIIFEDGNWEFNENE